MMNLFLRFNNVQQVTGKLKHLIYMCFETNIYVVSKLPAS